VLLEIGEQGLLEIERVTVGGIRLWVREEPRGRRWDLEVATAILEADEYLLAPLGADGPRLGWVLDIGAHIGCFTLAVKRRWPQARVIAAEPDPDNAALFRRNTEALRDIHLHETAVLGRGDRRLAHLRQAGRFNHDRNAAACWVAEAVEGLDRKANPPTLAVDCSGILELLDRYGRPPIDLLKLDCEGAEGEILLALQAAGYLARVGWIRGEWHFERNLPRIRQALGETHRLQIDEPGEPWGAFVAHRDPGG